MLRTRIAPTPSGYLHAGNGISFILTHALARAFDGIIVLRIDDLDQERRRPEYIADIFETLDWLGITWDEGPVSIDDFHRHFSQHQRMDMYYDALKNLQIGDYLYECRCSRADIRLHSQNGLYPKTCRNHRILTNDVHQKESAWRIQVEEPTKVSFREWLEGQKTASLDQSMGDFIVRQKNGLPSYQVASLCDDILFNINFIVRGHDLLASTAAQIFLAKKIHNTDFPENMFFHHPLLTNTEGVKFSKSEGAMALKQWRASRFSSATLYQKAAAWLNLSTANIEFIQDMDTLILSIKNTYSSPF